MVEMDYMESKMQDNAKGAISVIEELCNENQYLEEMLSWAYGKLHGRNFSNMDDALMADRIKLWLEHRIAG